MLRFSALPKRWIRVTAPVLATWWVSARFLDQLQSFVRNAAQRELLFKLDQAREYLLRNEPDMEHAKAMDRSYANLLRMWADV